MEHQEVDAKKISCHCYSLSSCALQVCLQTEIRFISDTARDLRMKQRSTTLDPKRKKVRYKKTPIKDSSTVPASPLSPP